MTYSLKLYVPDDTPPGQRQSAEQRFCAALETALGDAALVGPVYAAYQRLLMQHGEAPDPEALTVDERTVLEHWQMAEAAAMEAVFGPHRHLDEGGYEIVLIPD
jgi:non-ribosomal peptide synthetase component F